MELPFLGGASTVTGSRFLLTTGARAGPDRLRDVPGQPERDGPESRAARLRPAELDAILVTHAHLDHCGLLPVVVAMASRPDLPHERDGRARRDRPAGQRPAPGGVREARTTAGSGATPTRRRRPTRRRERSTSGASTGAAEDGGPRPDLGRAGRRRAAVAGAAKPTPRRRPIPRPRPRSRDHRRRRAGAGRSARRRRPPSRGRVRAASRRDVEADLDAPLYDEDDAKLVMPLFRAVRYGAESRSRRASRRRSSTPATSSARRSSASRSARAGGDEPTTIVFSGDLGRPGHADPPRPDARCPTPTTSSSSRPTAAASTSRRTRRSGCSPRRSAPSTDAGGVLLDPVVRDRADAGGRLAARPAASSAARSRAAAVPRLADGLERASDIYRRHPEFYDEETAQAARDGRHAARLPEPDDHPRRRRLEGDRARRAAVHDRGVERDADRRPRRRPPAQPDRRPGGDDPVRRLPGRGHARRAPPGRREDRQARRPGPRGPLPGPLDQRLLRPRRRVASCSTGCANFATGERRATPGYPRTVFLVHGDPRPSSRSRRRSRRSASRSTSRTGGSTSRSTEACDGRTLRCAPRLQVLEAAAHRLDRRRGEAHPRRGRAWRSAARSCASRLLDHGLPTDADGRECCSRRTSSSAAIATAPELVHAPRPRRQPARGPRRRSRPLRAGLERPEGARPPDRRGAPREHDGLHRVRPDRATASSTSRTSRPRSRRTTTSRPRSPTRGGCTSS